MLIHEDGFEVGVERLQRFEQFARGHRPLRQVVNVRVHIPLHHLRQNFDQVIQADVGHGVTRVAVNRHAPGEMRVENELIDQSLETQVLGITVHVGAAHQLHRRFLHQPQHVVFAAHLGQAVETGGNARVCRAGDCALSVHGLTAEINQPGNAGLFGAVDDLRGAPVVGLLKIVRILVGEGRFYPSGQMDDDIHPHHAGAQAARIEDVGLNETHVVAGHLA